MYVRRLALGQRSNGAQRARAGAFGEQGAQRAFATQALRPDDAAAPLADLDRAAADIWLVAERLRDPGNLGTILRTGDAVLQARRVLSFAGTPTIVEDLWLPAAPFKGLTAERLADYHGPMYALFETEFNVRMVRAEEKIRAVPASDGREVLLKVAQGTPLLSVERLAYTYNDVPMELRRGYYRTDTHHYRNTLS